MKFENIKVYNFEGAFRGMRNPMNSWHLSDSYFGIVNTNHIYEDDTIAAQWCKSEGLSPLNYEEWDIKEKQYSDWLVENGILDNDEGQKSAVAAFIGPRDMQLAQKLVAGGPEHRKFLRQIIVSVDITAPIYWWKEFDTYKVGTVANSTSTMHKLTSAPITLDCFETEELDFVVETLKADLYMNEDDKPIYNLDTPWKISDIWDGIIEECENLRKLYLRTKDKRYWKALIQILPESWLQTRTITLNYENLYAIAHQRSNHKLTEWSDDFVGFIKSLPYANELIYFKG